MSLHSSLLYFSIIIPTYKDFRLIQCLEALIEQNFEKGCFEVIVVNNDAETLIDLSLEHYQCLGIKIVNEPVPGSYAARNAGVSHASGSILAFTDSDCIPDVDWLKNAKKYFDRDIDKGIGILAGDVQLFYRNTKRLSSAETYEKYTGFTQEQYASVGNCVTANWFSYKAIFSEMGGFNANLKSNGDTELSGRISKKHKVIYAPDVIVMHPARYLIGDITSKYRRLLGGTYSRRYSSRKFAFFWHVTIFTWRRMRFSLKKIVTVSPKESFNIFLVCIAIAIAAWKEYFHLINGGETKR